MRTSTRQTLAKFPRWRLEIQFLRQRYLVCNFFRPKITRLTFHIGRKKQGKLTWNTKLLSLAYYSCSLQVCEHGCRFSDMPVKQQPTRPINQSIKQHYFHSNPIQRLASQYQPFPHEVGGRIFTQILVDVRTVHGAMAERDDPRAFCAVFRFVRFSQVHSQPLELFLYRPFGVVHFGRVTGKIYDTVV